MNYLRPDLHGPQPVTPYGAEPSRPSHGGKPGTGHEPRQIYSARTDAAWKVQPASFPARCRTLRATFSAFTEVVIRNSIDSKICDYFAIAPDIGWHTLVDSRDKASPWDTTGASSSRPQAEKPRRRGTDCWIQKDQAAVSDQVVPRPTSLPT